MTSISVYLGEVCNNSGLSSSEKTDVCTTLQLWFRRICQGTPYSVIVQWVNQTPNITPLDLICYFVPSEISSVVSRVPGFTPNNHQSHGLTYSSQTWNCSEVYSARCRLAQSSNVNWLPQVAFHELMHNKLGLSDGHLHFGIRPNRSNIARSELGLGRSQVQRNMTPSRSNIAEMRAALGTPRRQWAGAWSAVNCNTFTDPMAGVLIQSLGGQTPRVDSGT